MGSNLPKYGIQAVIDGLPDFLKGMTSINKAIDDTSKATQDAAKKSSPLNNALDKAGAAVSKVTDKLKDMVSQSGPVGKTLTGITDMLGDIPFLATAATVGIAAIIAGVVALGAAFFALGQRGAPLQEIGRAFDSLTANVGVDSQTLLKNLQAASEGTVSNFDLIKTASTALLGVTGDFGKQFGESLPQFLKIAKVEADATGRSVNDLFNNLVEGVKKGTPKLIESTGLVIDQKAAYQDYANTLGITVAQLSDTEKSQALLNATLAAGAVAVNTLGGAQESNADKLDRIQATITNVFDGLAVSVQPVFGTILDGVQTILNVFAGFAPYLSIIFNFVGKVVAGIVKFLASIIPPDLPKRLFEGAAAAFGSFANGIIEVANKVIFPAVIGIAKFIADFLIGNSPPPKGPLSMIDKGGENVMSAWLEGIAGVSLDPVSKVAQQVSDALGNIGKESAPQVNARLAQLDQALLPFQNRLDIIKAQFESINEPAKDALAAIDRQTAELQNAVAQGDPQAAARLRLLDQQRDAIQAQVDAQQTLVDNAQIQLGLAQAQQAPERALLNIRKAYLDALAKSQPTGTASSGGAAPKKEPKPTGAAPIDTSQSGGAVPTVPSTAPSVLDLVGGQDAIDNATQGIQTAFTGAIDQSGLQDFAQNSLDLGKQVDRIKSVDIGAKIADKFKGLTDAFNPAVAGSIANSIFLFFNGDANTPNSMASFVAHLGDNFDLVSVGAKIQTALSNIFDPNVDKSPANIIVNLIKSVVGDEKDPGLIAGLFQGLGDRISIAASGLLDTLKTNIFDPVTLFLTGSDPGTLGGIINQAINLFTTLGPGIVGALQNFGGMVYNAVVVPIINVMNAAIGVLESAIRGIAKTFSDFLGSVIGHFDNASIGGTNLGGLVPQALRDFQGNLAGVGTTFTIARISTALPSFLQAPAGAKGGLFGDGLFKVGEKGPEYLFSGQKFGVLPNQLTQVLDSLSSVLAQPSPMALPMGGNTTNNNSNSSFTFNGVQSDNDARRRYNYLRAGMR